MSSKLRLDDLAFDHDEMGDDYVDNTINSRQKRKKSKRKKQDFDDYSQQRTMKRRSSEDYGFR